LSGAQEAALAAAATRIPLTWASNFSLGVAVLHELVERAARALQVGIATSSNPPHPQAGCALGTADARRCSRAGWRPPHYASIRAGDIVGEHLVQFTAAGERIELAHRASNRDIFARGALHVAARLKGRSPARYRVADLL
jgi:4-hydroxy-tetrahydrodipicolinate reductase